MNKRYVTTINVIVAVAAMVMSAFLLIYSQNRFKSYALSLTPIPAVIPTITSTMTPTVKASYTPEPDATATVGAAFTQLAVSTLTVIPTSTALPQSQPTGNSASIQQELTSLRKEIIGLQMRVDSLSQNNPSGLQSADIRELQDSVDKLDQRLETIETVILDNPAKALEVTSLHQEIKNVQEVNQQDISSTKAEIARMYDLNKWFLGLMFTMTMSLVSLAVSNYMKLNKQDNGETRKIPPKKMSRK